MMFAVRVMAGTYSEGQTQPHMSKTAATFADKQRWKKAFTEWLGVMTYLFTDIQQCFVELFINTPEDVKVKHV